MLAVPALQLLLLLDKRAPPVLSLGVCVTGAHWIMLGTYADVGRATQYAQDSPQLKWLRHGGDLLCSCLCKASSKMCVLLW